MAAVPPVDLPPRSISSISWICDTSNMSTGHQSINRAGPRLSRGGTTDVAPLSEITCYVPSSTAGFWGGMLTMVSGQFAHKETPWIFEQAPTDLVLERQLSREEHPWR